MYSSAQTALTAYLEQIENDGLTARCHLSGNGAVESLENKLKAFYNMRHALCVDSATNGLFYLALAVGLRKKEIVTSPLSYGATISGALWLGNKFHFADIDNTLNISPCAVRKALKEHTNIKAFYAVDFAGIPHDMFAMRQICDEFGIWYFADAAQSLGAEINRSKASSLADALVVSFSPGKTVFCGEGACILTNQTGLYKRLVSITQHPFRMKRDIGLGAYSELGLNGRINPLAAIVGDAIFNQCLQHLKSKQAQILSLYSETDRFHSITPFHFVENGFLPAFFHLPLSVNDIEQFKQEYHRTMFVKEGYGFNKASFELLPEQLKRIGKEKSIRSNHIALTYQSLKKLYLLRCCF